MIFDATSQKVDQVSTEFRQVSTPIPAPGTAEALRGIELVESRSMHGQLPIIWGRAKDFSVYDLAGNKFIDMTSTIFVANVGHSNDVVRQAIKTSLDSELIASYAYGHKVKAEYLSKLLEFAGPGFEKGFLMSSGTEASEAIFKLTRLHGQVTGKGPNIITIQGNWHGRTMGAQLMSSNSPQKEWIGIEKPHVHHIPFPYSHTVSEKDAPTFFDQAMSGLVEAGLDPSKDVSGFYLETFQGWGAHFYPKSYVQALASFAKREGILLAFDEMQSGFGRTGRNFGFMHYEVLPDLIAVGKGMGNGVPISGVLGAAKILDLPSVGNMSSTHSANPMVCSAGLAVLEELASKNLVREAETKGEVLQDLLRNLAQHTPEVALVTGKGLIAAVIFSDEIPIGADRFASAVAERCMQKGVLVVHTGRESIKLGPPLTITIAALKEAISVIESAITEVRGRHEG